MKKSNVIIWKKGERMLLKALLLVAGIGLLVDAYLWIDTFGFTLNIFAL